MKPLDIVITPNGKYAIIKETNYEGEQASIMYFNNEDTINQKNAWWYEHELKVIDSIPRLLASCMWHTASTSGLDDVKHFFPIT